MPLPGAALREKLADVSKRLPPSFPAELSCQYPSRLAHVRPGFYWQFHCLPPNLFLSVGIFLREAGTEGGNRAGLKTGGASASALEQSRSKGRGGECSGEAQTPQTFKPFCSPPWWHVGSKVTE